jgi:hypothetical protein
MQRMVGVWFGLRPTQTQERIRCREMIASEVLEKHKSDVRALLERDAKRSHEHSLKGQQLGSLQLKVRDRSA